MHRSRAHAILGWPSALLAASLLLASSVVNATDLVSVNGAGTESGNGRSTEATISADGRFIAFSSLANDLGPSDTNGLSDVYVRDLQTGTTILVSVDVTGTASGNASSGFPVISADGRIVAFSSDASNLVASDTNGLQDVFVRDLAAGTTALVSVNSVGTDSGNDRSHFPEGVSADGRFVVFASQASDLVPNDANATQDVFVRDLAVGTTALVSVNSAGTGSGDGSSQDPVMTPDGHFVAFSSTAIDLVPADTNGEGDVFVRDMQAGVTTLVSVTAAGTEGGNDLSEVPTISADGRFVAFTSYATDLGPTDTNAESDVYLRDLQTETTTLVSVNSAGTDAGNQDSDVRPLISADGRFVVFLSSSSDLVDNDTNGAVDLFVRDLQAGTTAIISINAAGTDSGNADTDLQAVMSADGRLVVFASHASDLVVTDTNAAPDVFVRDVVAGVTTLLSINGNGTDSGNGLSEDPVLSGDGRFVAFASVADDLGLTDNNGVEDVYRVANFVSPDGVVGTAGGTVADGAGTGANFNVAPWVLLEDTSVFIEVLPDPGANPPPGFSALGTFFVDFTLNPNPSPLPLPGATITLPLDSPLAEGTDLSLFKYDLVLEAFVDTGIVGTVDAGGTTATFNGVTDFSVFVGFREEPPSAITVAIDIKPGSFPNSINLGSQGNVPVAIFSTTTFDATMVDPITVTLASAPVKLKGNGAPLASPGDVDGDGLVDLVVHVETQAFELSKTDTEAILEAQTLGGESIEGRDTVRVVP